MAQDAAQPGAGRRWLPSWLRKGGGSSGSASAPALKSQGYGHPAKWSMGILNDRETVEVPGSVLLLAKDHNEPLGLRNAPARTSHSSIAVAYGQPTTPPAVVEEVRKKTPDGKIILEPQPEDSVNDPLNWPTWRRDAALLSLGLYCMVGGGTTPLLAAGFTNVAADYGVAVSRVSLTTGLYMLGMGLGSVFASPTAILYGKRPVYLVSAVLYIITSVWCALSPNFASLIVARIFQGVSVSPVECLPSATIAEIFFLHERAYRIGIYTLLLLGGKNLVPLVSAVVIQSLGWRWVFWIVVFVVAFCGTLLFFFVPETFWDRSPVPRKRDPSRPNFFRRLSSKNVIARAPLPVMHGDDTTEGKEDDGAASPPRQKGVHVGFAASVEDGGDSIGETKAAAEHHSGSSSDPEKADEVPHETNAPGAEPAVEAVGAPNANRPGPETARADEAAAAAAGTTTSTGSATLSHNNQSSTSNRPPLNQNDGVFDTDSERQTLRGGYGAPPGGSRYTHLLREQPARSFVQQLRPYNGRLNHDKWAKVLVRPLILFSYPAVLWSAVVYSCSIGWLIVISESVAVVYRDSDTYHFTALQTGLVYISPFVGGILGTAVAGKVSDVIVKAMARRNGGLYEPEFRLVMAAPVAVTTVIGLMGFGWSAEAGDPWIAPTVFFGAVSFGCALGSTTSITFCVDSYRQYAGEALVTLNFSKNIFHGLVFSLFVTGWITSDGPKTVYIWIGVIQLIMMAFTVPMYIYGKRARMWTVRKNFMERF